MTEESLSTTATFIEVLMNNDDAAKSLCDGKASVTRPAIHYAVGLLVTVILTRPLRARDEEPPASEQLHYILLPIRDSVRFARMDRRRATCCETPAPMTPHYHTSTDPSCRISFSRNTP